MNSKANRPKVKLIRVFIIAPIAPDRKRMLDARVPIIINPGFRVKISISGLDWRIPNLGRRDGPIEHLVIGRYNHA